MSKKEEEAWEEHRKQNPHAGLPTYEQNRRVLGLYGALFSLVSFALISAGICLLSAPIITIDVVQAFSNYGGFCLAGIGIVLAAVGMAFLLPDGITR